MADSSARSGHRPIDSRHVWQSLIQSGAAPAFSWAPPGQVFPPWRRASGPARTASRGSPGTRSPGTRFMKRWGAPITLRNSLLSQPVLPVHLAHDLRYEYQVNDDPYADNGQRAVANHRRPRCWSSRNGRLPKSGDEHRPRGSEPSKVEPMSSHRAEKDREDVCRAVGCRANMPNQRHARLRRRLRHSRRRWPPCSTIPPLPLPACVEMPAGSRRRCGTRRDSTVPGLRRERGVVTVPSRRSGSTAAVRPAAPARFASVRYSLAPRLEDCSRALRSSSDAQPARRRGR